MKGRQLLLCKTNIDGMLGSHLSSDHMALFATVFEIMHITDDRVHNIERCKHTKTRSDSHAPLHKTIDHSVNGRGHTQQRD